MSKDLLTQVTNSPVGLTSAEAHKRLATFGFNELPSEKSRSLFAIAFAVVREPMFMLLLACSMVYWFIGEPLDALMLGFAIVFMMAITIVQERRTENAIAALRALAMPMATAIRDGRETRLASREIVPGDVVLIREGDRIIADAVMLEGINLAMDESLLTGESVSVNKVPAKDIPATMAKPGGDGSPFLFSGTLAVQGRGLAHVIATGQSTAMGAIGGALAAIKPEPTRIQAETARVVRVIAAIALIGSAVLAAYYGISQNNWLQGALAGLTLAMSLLPEEMPVVLTVFLGIGAWRIAQHGVLARRSAAIEMLGAITVLCVDKTGTLTENKMALAEVRSNGEVHVIATNAGVPLPETFHELIEYAILASHRDPFDPMEKAIIHTGHALLHGTEHLHAHWKLIDEYPLAPELLAMSRVWQSPDQAAYVISAKGAPEAIADLCHFNAAQLAALQTDVNTLASSGLRVLGVARANFSSTDLPRIQHDFAFTFCGLIALADPLRHSVPRAIRECQHAGIRVKMITGDYPATALNIAAQAGIRTPAGAISGDEIDRMNASASSGTAQRIKDTDVFCRVTPQQKLALVTALKQQGEIVAMTGDGVNDAPALKAAHVGVAMGERGTDVAREAASIVLMKDDFASIVSAIAAGRRIFNNLRKAFAFLIATHIPIAGMALIPVALGMPMVLLPIHIMFLELIIDPACSIVFEMEPADSETMKRPPHKPDESLFDRGTLLLGITQGIALLFIVLVAWFAATSSGLAADNVRSITFTCMVVTNLALIVASRGRATALLHALFTRNVAFWIIVAVTLLALVASVEVAFLRNVFRFAPIDMQGLAICTIGVVAALAAFEVIRRVARSHLT